MKLKNFSKYFLLFSIIMIVLVFQINSKAQEGVDAQPEENWLRQYNIYPEQYLFHRYDLYSKDDIAKFREKLESINNSKTANEWEGNYSVGYDETVSFSQLRWSANEGFVRFYIYTCFPELRSVNYGKVLSMPDFIQLISEKPTDFSKSKNYVKYIKVKWDERYYLVEESSLLAFAEKSVGIYVEPENTTDENYQKWSNFWVKGNFEKPLKGMPQFPASYKKFQRSPIEGNIISVGKRTIEEGKILGNTVHGAETAFYSVTINAGKTKNVKVGMTFDIPEIQEEVIISKVNQNASIGLIPRVIDDNKKDVCYDDEYNSISCPQIKSSLKIKTQIGKFWLF